VRFKNRRRCLPLLIEFIALSSNDDDDDDDEKEKESRLIHNRAKDINYFFRFVLLLRNNGGIRWFNFRDDDWKTDPNGG
jgi:hypothetical protein